MSDKGELRRSAIDGFKWGFIDQASYQIIHFIIGIILARLLLPAEFGLVGMVAVVFAISQTFVDSGFSQALIRKQDCTDADYSTVFFFNFAVGTAVYIIIFFCSPFIAGFFNEPRLVMLIRILGLNLIINAASQVQRTIRTKKLDFKLQTRISVISTISSGSLGIWMAFSGYGVWSLVGRSLAQNLISSGLLWYWNNWFPIWAFSKNALREMFGFGSKLLMSGLLETAYRNIYYLIIGKYFSAAELGYYTRADGFKRLPAENITGVVSRVSYPVLSQMQSDPTKLKNAYKNIIKSTMLITFVLMLGMAASAENLIITLVGIKWEPSVLYLRLLCFAGMLYPLHSLNLNMLKVKGRSDLFLKLEVIKKILAVPTIVVGIIFGIKIMLIGMIINSFTAYFLNSYWSGELINYGVKEQIKDIAPSFVLGVVGGLTVLAVGFLEISNGVAKLVLQIFSGGVVVIVISEILNIDAYVKFKKTLKSQFMTKSI